MTKQRRRRFGAAEGAEIWDRWQRGEGLKLIGRVFGKSSSSIFAHLRPHGGIRPVPRRRASRALSLAEREEISRGVAVGASLRSIAARLGRAASTVSRELVRNGGCRRYRAAAADKRAWGSCFASQAVQAGNPWQAAADRCRKVRAELVASADCRLAEPRLPG
jgi:hypothetical protein